MTDEHAQPSPEDLSIEPTVLPSSLQALLFTDIVDSTGIKGRAGTGAYTASLRRHNELIEQAVAGFPEAKIIKHTGDGFFVLFPTTSVAVRCALRFQRALAKENWPGEPIRARVGIHAGEIAMVRMVDRTDIVGTPADLAARIMSLGAGGQILVSRVAADEARQFIAGEKVRWTRHGLYNLKGVVSPVEIWEVADAQATKLAPPAGSVEPSNATDSPATDATETPKQIGPYRIVEKLGEGGMGTVYKAEQRSPVKRTVALKLVKAGMGSAEVLARFESERQALARMNHAHIAKVLDASADTLGRAYFVMEYVPGIRITKFADDNKLSIKQRLELFLQVCDAIAHAHTKSILHRDITAANVMAYMDGDKATVKVIDFGIAKALTGDKLTDRTFNTDRGKVIGTYDAMSPEQAEGSPDIDTRTDVYSLGVLLYELLTGAKPFDHAQAADEEIRRRIRDVDPPRPSTRLSTLGEAATTAASARREKIESLTRQLRSELEWIPLMAMRKERDRRYSSPTALADDIKGYLEGKPLLAAPDSTAYRFRKFIRRNRGPIIVASIVLAVLLLGIAGTTTGLILAQRATARAVAEKKQTDAALAEAARQRDESQREEEEAKKQKDIADAVSNFQADMLETADPFNLMGDKVTVVQAMNAAVKKLDAHESKLSPLSEADVRSSIGTTYCQLGRYAEGEANLRIALDIRRKALPAGNPDIVNSLEWLAASLDEQRKLAEAEKLSREAVEICRKTLPAGDPGIADSLSSLGRVLHHQNKDVEAEMLLREAVEICRKSRPPAEDSLGSALNVLGLLLWRENKLAEAESIFREVQQIYRKSLPPGHGFNAIVLNNLASVLSAENRPSEAEPLYREALDISRRTLPDGHPDIAMELGNFGGLLDDEGKLAEAESLYREALQIKRRALPAEDPRIYRCLSDLADLLRRESTFDAARPFDIFGVWTNASLSARRLKLEDARALYGELQERDLRLLLAKPTTAPSIAVAAETEPRRKFINSVGMRLVEIKPGSFLMGCPADEHLCHRPWEVQHKVTLTKPFFIGATPVTQEQYAAIKGEYPSKYLGKNLPVECVSWTQAVDFCNRLSAKEGRTYRLPTEAEWEYSCRAGTTTAYYTGEDEQSVTRAAWYGGANGTGNSSITTHPVGQLLPNAWGLYDQLGNVHEFVGDWMTKYPPGDQVDPKGPPSGKRRAARGGSFFDGLEDKRFDHRCANRFSVLPDERWSTLGFRVVLETDGTNPDAPSTQPASSQPATTQAAGN